MRVTLHGTVWGLPILLPQYPRLMGIIDSFARMIAPLIAVATSFEHLTPSPTCPLKSPTATNAWKFETILDNLTSPLNFMFQI